MTDEELVGYAEIHCETELALFSVQHLRRLVAFAGLPLARELAAAPDGAFWSAWRDTLGEVVAACRDRLAREDAARRAYVAWWDQHAQALDGSARGDRAGLDDGTLERSRG